MGVLLLPMLLPMASATSSAEARARERRASMARAKARGEAWTLKRSASLPISLHPLEVALGELLEDSSTSHLQARQLEVSQAPLSEELPVPVLAMLLPTGSATSSVEVERAERGVREAKVVGFLISLEAREEREARERARVGRV